MVVMEFLDESWSTLVDGIDRLKNDIHHAIDKLHQEDMVHGDLRCTNVMWKKIGDGIVAP